MAVQRWTWRRVARTLREPIFADGGFLEGRWRCCVLPVARWDCRSASLVSSLGLSPLWQRLGRFKPRGERPLELDPFCPVCLQDPGPSYGHVWWMCDLTRGLKRALPTALRPCPSNVGSVFYSTGLAPSPIHNKALAAANSEAVVVWTRPTGDGRLYGTVCTDGSGMFMSRRTTARVGWGLATLQGDTPRVCGALHGPLPLFT